MPKSNNSGVDRRNNDSHDPDCRSHCRVRAIDEAWHCVEHCKNQQCTGGERCNENGRWGT